MQIKLAKYFFFFFFFLNFHIFQEFFSRKLKTLLVFCTNVSVRRNCNIFVTVIYRPLETFGTSVRNIFQYLLSLKSYVGINKTGGTDVRRGGFSLEVEKSQQRNTTQFLGWAKEYLRKVLSKLATKSTHVGEGESRPLNLICY